MSTIMRKVNVLSRCEGVYRTDRLKVEELKHWHHSYLLAICNNPGMSQEELAQHICVNKSNVTRTLTYLEENGYVNRQSDGKDRRVMHVYPTQKATELLPNIRKITLDYNEYLAEELTKEEFEEFQTILEKLVVRAEKYIRGREEK